MGNLIVGIIFVIGGLSGTLALRGTGSTIALAVLGAVLVVIGCIQLSSRSSSSRGSRAGRPGVRRTAGAARGVRTGRTGARRR